MDKHSAGGQLNIIALVSKWGIVVYLITSLIPLLKSDQWFVRAWDFPRLQLLIIGLMLGLTFMLTSSANYKSKVIILVCLLIGTGFDFYRVFPYTFLWPKESVQSRPKDNTHTLSLITVNVLQKNDNPQPLLELIENKSPDIIFLIEVNERWARDLSHLEETYPYKLVRPLDNTYGLAIYSKLEFKDAEIRELIEENVPSIYAKVKLRSGDMIEIYGLHPKPPRYETGDSTQRDAELIQVAKRASNATIPVIVMGDLNDVAWSHTTRLFRRLSNLLDPRVGRGTFPTFPANIPLFRFPLDYVFHSDHLTLVSIKRLDDIGSDHFPMFIELNLTPRKEEQQDSPSKNEGDVEEARETMQRVR